MNNSQEIILAQISAIYDKPPFVKVKTGQMEMILKCILFRTLLNRSMWANPISNVMDGWWNWKVDTNGEKVLTTECFENIILMFPFTVLLMWTAKEKMIKHLNIKNIILKCTQVAFLFSVCIEFLQLFLRLGAFQLSDIFYMKLVDCLEKCLICRHIRRFAD